MEKVWHHTFDNELRASPREHPILTTESPVNNKPNREKMTQIVFETFDAPALYLGIQQCLALQASGRTTGLVVDFGVEVTDIVPVYKGFSLQNGIIDLNYAGDSITEQLCIFLVRRGYQLSTDAAQEVVRRFKENLCYVALDYEQEFLTPSYNPQLDSSFELPDGQILDISYERLQAPNALFDRSLAGLDLAGLHVSMHNIIYKCDIDLRNHMFTNIILICTKLQLLASKLTCTEWRKLHVS
jgi:actin-related protein